MLAIWYLVAYVSSLFSLGLYLGPKYSCEEYSNRQFLLLILKGWMMTQYHKQLKVHKIENFFGSECEFCTISLLVLLKY